LAVGNRNYNSEEIVLKEYTLTDPTMLKVFYLLFFIDIIKKFKDTGVEPL
jgi:hypothetical protein